MRKYDCGASVKALLIAYYWNSLVGSILNRDITSSVNNPFEEINRFETEHLVRKWNKR